MMTPTHINWRKVGNRKQWLLAYETLNDELNQRPWMRAFLRVTWGRFPDWLEREVREVSSWLSIPSQWVRSAQIVYDELWSIGDDYPVAGCTSVSHRGKFGRNLDYGFPDNAADLVYHTKVKVGGQPCTIQGMAGVLGFLAISDTKTAAAINQAPKHRRIRRSGTPGLAWFRSYAEMVMLNPTLDDEGEVWLNKAPAADVLVHFVRGSKSFLAETYGRQLVWEHRKGKQVQTNAYQILDLPAEPSWEEESQERAALAYSARGISASLKAASVEGWTIDSVILK